MSKFKYTEQENEINKVLKRIKMFRHPLVNNAELKKTRKSADENIAASLELLRSLGKGDEADEAMKSARKKQLPYHLLSSLKLSLLRKSPHRQMNIVRIPFPWKIL